MIKYNYIAVGGVDLIIKLNGKWSMSVDGINYNVNVPSAIQSYEELSGKFPSDAMQNGFIGTAEFTKQFEISGFFEYMVLTLKGIMPYAEVYVNDNYIGEVEYCQTAFEFEISDFLQMGINTLRIVIKEKNLDLIGGMRFDVLNWSGIFDDVFIKCTDFRVTEPCIICGDDKFKITAKINAENVYAEIKITDDGCVIKKHFGRFDNIIETEFDMSGCEMWSIDNPKLYTAEIAVGKTEYKFKFGIRTLECSGNRILLNKIPFYAFGGGEEYFSPTISPLIDKDIIRKRFKKFKELGFNFYRYHTHSPTETELQVCDELGIMVSVEIPILSNFNRIKDTQTGFEILKNYIIQTRTHPCIADYCLGNEGAQLLVKDKKEHITALNGYSIIKENTKNQLAMLCFGYQGETPQLPNDIMTPHLWSQEFRWAYDGLAKTPWSFLEGALDNKPCIVHEFGKYGVCPDGREDKLMPQNGYCLSAEAENDKLFAYSGLEDLKERIIQNSRRLSVMCARTAFEAMRRQSGISGYVYWTFFRMGLRCGGLCDDMGEYGDSGTEILKSTANSPLGIFADRDFYGRTFGCGENAEFNITVSNFSGRDVSSADLKCVLTDNNNIFYNERFMDTGCKMGEISKKAKINITMPPLACPTELKLYMSLEKDSKILCENSMELWCYPNEKINLSDKIVYFVHDEYLSDSIETQINGAVQIWNWISILLGCVIPEYGFVPSDDKLKNYIDDAMKKSKPDLLICDRIDEVSELFTKCGVPVLYIDNGGFDNNLYPDEIPGNTFFDLNTFYAPFRAGWDEGNCTTVIDGELFNQPENDGWADLRYYSCIQGKEPILRNKIIEKLGLTDINNSIRLIQRIKNKEEVTKNSTVYFEKMQTKKINDCVYYIDGKVNGTKTAVAAMKLFNDSCGKYTLKRIIKLLTED